MRFVSWLLILALFVPSVASAQSSEGGLISTGRKLDTGMSAGSVYYSGNYPGAVLMRVNILGEVQKPGVHHVPVDTDFNTVLGFAGGPTRWANMKEAVIKRKAGGEEKIIPVNLDKYFREVHRDIALKPNDTFFVPMTQGVISDNTYRVILALSFVSGIILSVVSVHQLTKGNN